MSSSFSMIYNFFLGLIKNDVSWINAFFSLNRPILNVCQFTVVHWSSSLHETLVDLVSLNRWIYSNSHFSLTSFHVILAFSCCCQLFKTSSTFLITFLRRHEVSIILINIKTLSIRGKICTEPKIIHRLWLKISWLIFIKNVHEFKQDKR